MRAVRHEPVRNDFVSRLCELPNTLSRTKHTKKGRSEVSYCLPTTGGRYIV